MKRVKKNVYAVYSPYGDILTACATKKEADEKLNELKKKYSPVYYPIYKGNMVVRYEKADLYVDKIR